MGCCAAAHGNGDTELSLIIVSHPKGAVHLPSVLIGVGMFRSALAISAMCGAPEGEPRGAQATVGGGAGGAGGSVVSPIRCGQN
jgi:hypothetical protein